MAEEFVVRPAGKEDVAVVLELMYEMADFEGVRDELDVSPELLAKWVFDEEKAEIMLGIEGGAVVGFAFYFTTFSSFLGLPGLYVEELYVKPEYRGKGYGKIMLCRLARLVVQRGYGRLEWACSDWNKPSIQFYTAHGAQPMDEWTVYRLTGDELKAMGGDDGEGCFGKLHGGTKVFQ